MAKPPKTYTTTTRSSNLVAPEITYHVPSPTAPYTSLVRPLGPPASHQSQQQLPDSHASHTYRAPPPKVTPVPPPKIPIQPSPQFSSLADGTMPISNTTTTNTNTTSGTGATTAAAGTRTDRNIDNVVLGNLRFRTWYPSYYGKELLGAIGPSNDTRDDSQNHSKSLKKETPPTLPTLYVCPSCFKYSKELAPWWEHLLTCDRHGHIPGKKIYAHPKDSGRVPVPQAATTAADSSSEVPKRKMEGGAHCLSRHAMNNSTDEGEWSIWEVDGEDEGLFCQNLSLFAKLFLDNKSVFFDVSGFNYFLLVYTPPPESQSYNTKPSSLSTSAFTQTPTSTTPRIIGFFSKEKMSWDSNNLACILVFPPWQRKGLGALLIGASYEISRREGLIGGPEKPISELGRRGYQRYWVAEISRWLLSLDNNDDNEGLVVVDARDCSAATWIVLDDCVAVLRDMGVVVEEEGGSNRIRVDKEAVRRYMAAHRINLERSCAPDGFWKGYVVEKRVSICASGDEHDVDMS